MIDESLIVQATYTDLVNFCRGFGFNVVKKGNCYSLKEHDSLYISAREPWKWYRFSTEEGGKAIDFCTKVLQMSFLEAVQALTGSVPAPAPSDARRVIAYLCKKRCIDYEIVKHLIQVRKLGQDESGNCVFAIQNFEGVRIGAELHGTGDKRYKAISVSGKFEGYAFSLGAGSAENVCYFESAIDLLSFCQLYYRRVKNYLLVSMGGLRSVTVCKYREHYPDAQHLLFVDHDGAGENFAREMKMQVKFPTVGKDWNEYLQYIKEEKQ